MNTIIHPIDKSTDKIRIFIDGQLPLAHAVTRKLIENHGVSSENLIVNTYHRLDNAPYADWLKQQNITYLTETYKDNIVFDILSDFKPDYIISAYGLRILPKKILNLARVLAFNLHPSYLPDYKGRWIPSWIIINGETEYGITIHIMDEGIDTGPILFQKKLPIALDDTAYSLYNKIVCNFITVFDSFFQDLVNGRIVSRPMPPGGRYFGKSMPYDGVIDPAWSIEKIERFIRSMVYPPHRGAVYQTKNGVFECLNLQDYLKVSTQI